MKFNTYKEAAEYCAKREQEVGKMKFRSSDEYRAIYPQIDALYKSEGHKRPKKTRYVRHICISA